MALEIGDLKDGDRLRWTLPRSNLPIEAQIVRLNKIASIDGGEYAVDFFCERLKLREGKMSSTFQRCVPFSWITHVNKKRVSRHDLGRQDQSVSVDSGSRSRSTEQLDLDLIHKEDEEMADLKTTTRKSLDEMSESHREHIERWEPHLEALRGEHVWAAVMRISGRGVTGPCYVALKRGSKDYVICDYDTDKKPDVTPKRVLAGPFDSSSTLMEEFKKFRAMAKEERTAAKEAGKGKPKPVKKTRKVAAKKTTKTPAAKKTAAKKPTRTRKPRSK